MRQVLVSLLAEILPEWFETRFARRTASAEVLVDDAGAGSMPGGQNVTPPPAKRERVPLRAPRRPAPHEIASNM